MFLFGDVVVVVWFYCLPEDAEYSSGCVLCMNGVRGISHNSNTHKCSGGGDLITWICMIAGRGCLITWLCVIDCHRGDIL